jgi:uncharacterized protein (TIGR02145 family)
LNGVSPHANQLFRFCKSRIFAPDLHNNRMVFFSFLRNIPCLPLYLLSAVLFLLSSCAQEKMVWDLAKVPAVRIGSPTEIKHSSFRISVQVESNEKLKEKGFCIAQTPNPTIKENKVLVDSGAASYSGLLINLWADTLYYIRAYATNATGTGYSKPIEVKTQPGFCPVLQTTAPVLSNNDKDITSGGNILDDGGYPILARGICWSLQPDPVAGQVNSTNDGTGRESFTSQVNGLQPGKTYYLRAYATNKAGTCYGNLVSSNTQVSLPIISTNAALTITSTTATSGGNITFDGGGNITARGICWSTSQNPTTDLSSKTNDGIGVGSFSSNLTGLSTNTIYYVRAYAVNNAGTSYGTQISFTTQPVGLPVISTTDASAVTTNSAITGGNISSDGGGSITARGVCWSTSQNPTIALSTKTTDGSGVGSFTSNITGLAPGTTYYLRAYAVNNAGTAYGNQISITTIAALPLLTTTSASNVTTTMANCGGNISSDGGGSIIARGVCWNTSQNPNTTLSTKTNNGNGTGVFVSSITGLNPNASYYVRAYATTSAGTAYGNEISFTTNPVVLPTITTTGTTSITNTTTSSGGNISSDGGGIIAARGVCWSTSQNPTISLSTKTNNGTGSGSYTSSISGLLSGTTYYVRAYATNSVGTSYGGQISFTTTGSQTLSDIDGNTYETVIIGTQVWMKENLKTTTYSNGDPIPTNLSNISWKYTFSGACANYNDDAANISIYGKLYNWYAVADSRGLCPLGWHVPSDAEWTILENYLGGSSVAGGKMKAVSSLWISPNIASNTSGFSGLPGGLRDSDGNYNAIGNYGDWWSFTESSTTNGWYRYLSYNYVNSYRFSGGKKAGFSVRCLRD